MADFAAMLVAVKSLMMTEFTVWGFTLSYWQIGLYGLIAYIVIRMVVKFFE